MIKRIRSAILLISILSVLAAAAPQPVHAGFFDRIQDIYNTPEKISELEAQYLEAKSALAEQQRQLEESRKAAEEYALKQRELAEQNERLIEQNASLQAEMNRMKKERKSFTDKLILTLAVAAGLLAAYFISVRLWRYSVWRKQRAAGERGIGG